ncbi:hypothetical protein CBR_g36439 [Chara braunii]|uniref:MADF domain-containing protein n=1 Tax=Chara braunii TaxID=69332 RepID=A0A388LL10_CHABU|nr:hypothetical protein CBR_g36439 [Chara braunii]|eukprot:GBG82912.1 hypothetical protein CBR_g36439 [Chara braunii]
MQGTAFDEGISQHQPNQVSRPVASQGGPRASVRHHPPSPAATVQEGRPDVTSVAESPRCVEPTVCRFNSLRASSDGEGARPDGAASEADFVDSDDDDDEDDEEEEVVVKEVTAGGKTKQASKGREKAKEKDKEGEKNGKGSGNGERANWNLDESLALVRCKRDQYDYFANVGHNYAQMKTKDQKWMDIAKRMDKEGVRRDGTNASRGGIIYLGGPGKCGTGRRSRDCSRTS